MGILEQGSNGEQKARKILKNHNYHNLQQCDWIVKEDGKYFVVEVKNKQLFQPPPFLGTGLNVTQIELRTQLLNDLDMDCLIIALDPKEKGIYYTAWLSELEKTESFDTKHGIRIYDLKHFKKCKWEG